MLLVLCGWAVGAAYAQSQWIEEDEWVILSPVKHEQRVHSRRNVLKAAEESACALENVWAKGKRALNEKLNLDIGADISHLGQRVSPNGKQTAIQSVYYPYLTWNLFKDTSLGSGQVNINYTLVHYWGAQAATLQGRTGQAVAFNDYAANQEFFSQFSYTHTLAGDWNWLSLTVGQFPLYNFDGTTYLANQQTALMNFAMSQNATSAYPTASFGGYLQAQNEVFSVVAGYQDATNVTGEHIKLDTAFDGKYTLFGSLSWTPTFGVGNGQYSVMYYYQPSVAEQSENVNGWSFNMQQNWGEKWVTFARANGAGGGATGVKNSYVLGGAFLDPLKRNKQDAIIAGVSYNRLSGRGLGEPPYYRSGEMTLELQWVWGIGQLVTITPDLQLYPSAGLNTERHLNTVVGLRTTVML